MKIVIFFSSIFLLNSCKSQSNDLKRSNQYVDRATELFRSNSRYNHRDTNVLLTSLTLLDTALSLDAKNNRAWQTKAAILTDLSRKAELIQTLRSFHEMEPINAEICTNLGLLYDNFKQRDSALYFYRQAHDIYELKAKTQRGECNLIFVDYLIDRNKDKALKKLNNSKLRNADCSEWVKSFINELDSTKDSLHSQ